jgi:Tfp pilus assembly protein PilO
MMPNTWLWGILASLLLVMLAAVLKTVAAVHAKKLADDECTRLRQQLDAQREEQHKVTLSMQQDHAAEVQQLTQRISELEKRLKLYTSKPINYPPLNIV